MGTIGLDFDNTLVGYDELFLRLALERGLVDSDTPARKKTIRDQIRAGSGGDQAWQALQALAYGPRIGEARLYPDVPSFVKQARAAGAELHVVSHKTETAPLGHAHVNLRTAALGFMEAQGFFDAGGLGLSPARVHFCASRAEKVATIARLHCSHFVDDLEETFREPGFPEGTLPILFSPEPAEPPLPRVVRFERWADINRFVWGPHATGQ